MAINRNLGHKVTTRIISWEQSVRDAEGSRWNLPIGKYFFGDADQYVFVEYDDAIQAPPMAQGSDAPVLISAVGSYNISYPTGGGASGFGGPTLQGTANLVWTAPTEPSFPIIGWYIERSDTSAGPFYGIAAQYADQLTLSDTSVVPGNTYYYLVTGFDADFAFGANSNILPCPIPTPPAVTTDFTSIKFVNERNGSCTGVSLITTTSGNVAYSAAGGSGNNTYTQAYVGRTPLYDSVVFYFSLLVGANGSIYTAFVTNYGPPNINQQPSGTTNDLYGVNLIDGDGTVIAVGANGTILLANGTTGYAQWSAETSGVSVSLRSLDIFGDVIVVGDAGTIVAAASPYTSWSQRTSGTTQNLRAIGLNNQYNPTQAVVVGDAGTVLSSPDGLTWTSRSSGTSNDLYGIYWSASLNLWVAVGKAGAILTSPDAATWTTRTSGTTNHLYGIADTADYGGTLIAVGQNSTTLNSTDGINWVSV